MHSNVVANFGKDILNTIFKKFNQKVSSVRRR